jgi:hypothetical protein
MFYPPFLANLLILPAYHFAPRFIDNFWILMYNSNMKSKINACLCIAGLFLTVFFSNCSTTRQYNFSLKNTLSIFMLNDGKNYYFCIPVQYVGDYQIGGFEFNNGNIVIGDYDILLKRDEINISVYLNEAADLEGNSDGEFNLIYLEENGGISVSKMGEPLAMKQESDEMLNHYYIFIEKHLTNNEMKKIIKEYEKGNVYSKLSIWYDITIDDEEQSGSGMLDDFELYDGDAITWLPPNLDFFKEKYLQK